MGLPREVAKALIIDSAAGWEYKTSTYKVKDLIGYGIVPISINRVLETSNDEIRFVVYGISESYKTANYAIPVPKDEDNNYPYIARATMCYFPKCSRSQGVDYTNRELSLKFGRVKPDGSIEDINDNIQDDVGAYVDERASRREFRKWENTKFISKILKKNLSEAQELCSTLTSVISDKLRFCGTVTQDENGGLTQIFIQNVGSVEGKGDAFQIGEDGQLALGDRHLLGSASYPKGLKVKSFTLRYDASTDIFSVTLEIGDRSRQTLSQTSFEVKRINRTVT